MNRVLCEFGRIPLVAIVLGVCWGGSLPAATLDDIGFNRLELELGAALSTGNGVAVAQSEAVFSTGGYYPSTTHADFSGKSFTQASGAQTVSTHATSVGRSFYGNALSVSPGVTSIANYTATGWLNGDYLRSLTNEFPRTSSARVANHSWVSGGFGDEIINSLQRIDYLVEKDDFIQVAGVNNLAAGGVEAPTSLFASAFNVIMVGVSEGDHSTGAVDVSAPYLAAGKVRPHLVAPANQTSFAAPLAASTAALLIDIGRDHPGLSNGTQLSSAGRSNRTITNAETSEVIRAALMAGADRQAITDMSNGFTYNATSASGLDPRFGAGQLDVYQSYHIVAGGEQDALERLNVAGVGMYGFDYEASFKANEVRTYRFSVDEVTREFAASLAWNVDIDLEPVGLGGVLVDPSVDVRNLNLVLRDVNSGQALATSNGTGDVTENLYIPILPKGEYEMIVSGAGYSPTNPWSIEYALAWRFAPSSTPLMGDVNLDGAVSLVDLVTLQRNLGMSERALWTDGDLNLDGHVDRGDVALLAGAFGGGTLPGGVVAPGAGGSPGFEPVAIPEPSAVVLAACGAVAMLALRRRGLVMASKSV
ncbi:MAG: hypothetical protein DCC68_15740 [Planctomycetota bacterium]|nr:MAG: hypothetical protein DCC68_15740 [Planctomycetota bacterium]